jgi:hypothetical protein
MREVHDDQLALLGVNLLEDHRAFLVLSDAECVRGRNRRFT